ncbi:hypothetical protein C1H46_045626 [Malus baccata]|uniref:Uncharacterized protein n=1 Tax=Malus baccata TaxID=106549 RepID=A0A540K3N3_MALBA|nr:hypothetical protein C1H46_045626 [Malus baccata]
MLQPSLVADLHLELPQILIDLLQLHAEPVNASAYHHTARSHSHPDPQTLSAHCRCNQKPSTFVFVS